MNKLAAMVGLLFTAGCLFSPAIESEGYVVCQDSKECGPGRSCQSGYCAPPPWWNDKYSARYQLLAKNASSAAVPKAVLVEFLVGESGLFSLEQVGSGPVIIVNNKGKQTRALAMRDPRTANYAFVFQLPAKIGAKKTYGDLWLYVDGPEGSQPEYATADQVYSYFETFDEGDVLDPEKYRTDDDNYNLADGRILLRPGNWLTTQIPFVDGEVFVDMRLEGSDCVDFGLGLGSGHVPQDQSPPYAFFIGGSTGMVEHEIFSSPLASMQTVGESFLADGMMHTYAIAIGQKRVVFSIDHQVSADAVPEYSLDGEELFLHAYTNDCTIRIEEIRSAPMLSNPPTITAGGRVSWIP